MKELNERLRFARKRIFPTAKLAAEALGVKYQTYAGHENGSDGFTSASGHKYARKFGVKFEWLMTGRGEAPNGAEDYDDRPIWLMLLEEAVQAALDAGQTSPQIAASLTDILISLLPDKSQQTAEEDRTVETIAEGIARRSGVPKRKPSNGSSANTQAPKSEPTSQPRSTPRSRNP